MAVAKAEDCCRLYDALLRTRSTVDTALEIWRLLELARRIPGEKLVLYEQVTDVKVWSCFFSS
jgi:hypothetical protein